MQFSRLVIIHSGHYRPVDAPESNQQESPKPSQTILNSISVLSETGMFAKSPISSPVQPVIAEADQAQSTQTVLLPDHDLHVTLRVLPRLVKYTGCMRHGLDSRGWGASHDGESISVVKVEKVERGSVVRKGRKHFSKKWGEMAKAVSKELDDVPLNAAELEEDWTDFMTVVFSHSNNDAW